MTAPGRRPARAWRRLPLAACAALALWAGAARAQEAAAPAPPEPEGYRFEPYRARTPETLSGARVVTAQEAEALWREKAAVFVDVLPRPPRPANLPAGTVWRDPPHETIPGAVWLPNVGFGALDAPAERYFAEGLVAASGGDRNRPLVIFCLKDCWMSWNAARRALAAGYGRVAWFPTGVDGWKAAGLPLAEAGPWQGEAAR